MVILDVVPLCVDTHSHASTTGQTLIDGIPAAIYNVLLTSGPILLFALLDRPIKYMTTLMRYPQLYRRQQSLSTGTFWRLGVLMAVLHAAIIFFVGYYSMSVNGQDTTTDLFCFGKVRDVIIVTRCL